MSCELLDLDVMLNSASSPWNIQNPSRLVIPPAAKTPKRLDKPIHQSLSVFSLGGTRAVHQANRYRRRWDHSWTALPHKEKGPSLCLWPGGSPRRWWLVEDKCLALQWAEEKLSSKVFPSSVTWRGLEWLITSRDIISLHSSVTSWYFFPDVTVFEICTLSASFL